MAFRNLSGETDRQYSSSSQAKAEALQTVERVVSTVEELRRTMEQEHMMFVTFCLQYDHYIYIHGISHICLRLFVPQEQDVVAARLREHGLGLDELRRSTAEQEARQRAATGELQRQQQELQTRQRQNGDETLGLWGCESCCKGQGGKS